MTDEKAAVERLQAEYEPFADLLNAFSGRILDIGGGSGFARRFMPEDSEYICIDPSEAWLRPEWAGLAEHRLRNAFVVGVGELLPFPRNTFDGAIAMWSLNHVLQPELVLQEVSRVVKPGARFLAVLEDMEPTWLDAVGAASLKLLGMQGFFIQLERSGRETIKRKLINRLRRRRWPLASDHLRIHARDLERWCAGRFRRARRQWISGFLAYELVSLPKQAVDDE